MRDVTVASCAGACYGVGRALKAAEEAAEKAANGAGGVKTLGPLIHNPQVVEELCRKGVGIATSLDDVRDGTVVIRSHGVAPSVIERARGKGLSVVDATCPHVSKAQKTAKSLADDGYLVVVVGEEGHPEVEGICAYAGGGAIVADCAERLPHPLPKVRVGVVVQTTQTTSALQEVVAALIPNVAELKVHNTICQATQQRQVAARELAASVDAMIVVGGRNSGNTTRLAQICAEECGNTHHIETPCELDAAWFEPDAKVGVTAGASTPLSQIEAVVSAIEAL